MKYFGDTLSRQGKRLNIPICPLKINRFEIPDLIRFCNENKYHININEVGGADDISMDYLSSDELKEIKEFYQNQKFNVKDGNSKDNVAEFKDLILQVDRWIEKRIDAEHYMDNFDLGKDKIAEYQEIVLQKGIIGLKAIGYGEEDANALASAAIKKIENALSAMPDHFNSNHLYKKLTEISPNYLANYATGKEQTKSEESIITKLFFKK